MDTGQQVIGYLDELAHELRRLLVTTPFQMLIAGGAYMLLQQKRRSTQDIDFALLEPVQIDLPANHPFLVTVKRGEISGNGSRIPYAAEFKQAVRAVAQRHRSLPIDWCNDEASIYLYDDAPTAEVQFWRTFGDLLSIYLPTKPYILSTKIAAFRPKDERDIQSLLQDLSITTRAQAKAIVDRFLLPEAQEFWEVEEKLAILFLA
jgi:hypothetical protein